MYSFLEGFNIIWSRVIRFDTWVCDKLSVAYQWIYDLTGLLVGCIQFCIILFMIFVICIRLPSIPWLWLLLIMTAFIPGTIQALVKAYHQSLEYVEIINADAEAYRLSSVLLILRLLVVVLFVVSAIKIDIRLTDIIPLYPFIVCIKIKKRNRERFFAPKLATEAT